LNIIVPIKQVPETSNVKMDPETGTVIRSGVDTVVNPLDLYAIEAALRLKEADGGTVTAITMGPPQAVKALKEAVAMGCDAAVLISDRKFSGSDTWATSYTLAQAIKKIGKFDLIVTGERATDGDTAQVGPGIASWLDLPLATYVAKMEISPSCAGAQAADAQAADAATACAQASGGAQAAGTTAAGGLRVERLVEEGYQILLLPLPALVTVVKEIASPRLPTLRGKKYARQLEIPVFDTGNMDLDQASLGLKGSPTKVVKIATPRVTRGGRTVLAGDDEAVESAADELISFLAARGLV